MVWCYCGQCGGATSRRQTSEDSSRVQRPASAADVDDDDDEDEDDPFNIPEESDDLTGLTATSGLDEMAADCVKNQTADLELEPMSVADRKEKLHRGRHDGSVDAQSPSSCRSDSDRRTVSMMNTFVQYVHYYT